MRHWSFLAGSLLCFLLVFILFPLAVPANSEPTQSQRQTVLVESASKDSSEEPSSHKDKGTDPMSSTHPPPAGGEVLAHASLSGDPREPRPEMPGTSSTTMLGRAKAHSVLRRAGLSNDNLVGLVVDSNAFQLARQVLDQMERE
jgi:hypothetical protein